MGVFGRRSRKYAPLAGFTPKNHAHHPIALTTVGSPHHTSHHSKLHDGPPFLAAELRTNSLWTATLPVQPQNLGNAPSSQQPGK